MKGKIITYFIVFVMPFLGLGQKPGNFADFYFAENGFLPGSTCIILDLSNDTAKLEQYNHYYTRAYSFIKMEKLRRINNSDTILQGENILITIKKNRLLLSSSNTSIKLTKLKIVSESQIDRIRNLAYFDTKLQEAKDNGYTINRVDLFDDKLLDLKHNDFCKKIDQKYIDLTSKK